jgi:hypothetical protein
MSERYESARRMHEASARRHEQAAALWDTREEAKRAEFERQCAHIERQAAQLDADRSRLERLRASGLAHPDAAGRAEIDALSETIGRRGVRLQADDAALEQQRAPLWPHHDRPEQGRRAREASAPGPREGVGSESQRGASEAAADELGGARHVAAQTRETARRLASVLNRTADVLETSGALAQANAERLELLGRSDAGAEERRAAERAYEAAGRARLHEQQWLEVAVGRAP